MRFIVFSACCFLITSALPQNNPRGPARWRSSDDVTLDVGAGPALSIGQKSPPTLEEEDDLSGRDAFYSFQTDIDDAIKDGEIRRDETRSGQQVTGSYTYSDGFFRRTVQYIADENGYRVVGEQVTPIGNGPIENLNGVANVRTAAHGHNSQYSVRGKDINLRKDLREFKDIQI